MRFAAEKMKVDHEVAMVTPENVIRIMLQTPDCWEKEEQYVLAVISGKEQASDSSST